MSKKKGLSTKPIPDMSLSDPDSPVADDNDVPVVQPGTEASIQADVAVEQAKK